MQSRRSRTNRRTKQDEARFTWIIVNLAFFVMFFLITGKIGQSFLTNHRLGSEIKEKQNEMLLLKKEQQGLEEELALLNLRKGAQLEAKKHGWLEPGERSLRRARPVPPSSLPPKKSKAVESGLMGKSVESLNALVNQLKGTLPKNDKKRS